MDLKNMKIEKSEQKTCEPSMPVSPKDAYPCGLQLYLNDEELKKLGVTELPAVGEKLQVAAVVEVCGVSQDKSIYGEHRSLRLQITDMALGGKKE